MCGKYNDGRGQSGQKDLSIRSQCLNDCPSHKNWLTIWGRFKQYSANRFFSWIFSAKNEMVDVEMGHQKIL